MPNPYRGEQTVELGKLGTFEARPTFEAIARIEAATAPIVVIAGQLIDAYSVTLVARILFECIRAAQRGEPVELGQSRAPSYEEVGEAVLTVGVDVLVEVARALVMSNFSEPDEDE